MDIRTCEELAVALKEADRVVDAALVESMSDMLHGEPSLPTLNALVLAYQARAAVWDCAPLCVSPDPQGLLLARASGAASSGDLYLAEGYRRMAAAQRRRTTGWD